MPVDDVRHGARQRDARTGARAAARRRSGRCPTRRVDVANAVHRLHEDRPEGAERGQEDLALEVRPEGEEQQRDQRRRGDRAEELDRHPEGSAAKSLSPSAMPSGMARTEARSSPAAERCAARARCAPRSPSSSPWSRAPRQSCRSSAAITFGDQPVRETSSQRIERGDENDEDGSIRHRLEGCFGVPHAPAAFDACEAASRARAWVSRECARPPGTTVRSNRRPSRKTPVDCSNYEIEGQSLAAQSALSKRSGSPTKSHRLTGHL